MDSSRDNRPMNPLTSLKTKKMWKKKNDRTKPINLLLLVLLQRAKQNNSRIGSLLLPFHFETVGFSMTDCVSTARSILQIPAESPTLNNYYRVRCKKVWKSVYSDTSVLKWTYTFGRIENAYCDHNQPISQMCKHHYYSLWVCGFHSQFALDKGNTYTEIYSTFDLFTHTETLKYTVIEKTKKKFDERRSCTAKTIHAQMGINTTRQFWCNVVVATTEYTCTHTSNRMQ